MLEPESQPTVPAKRPWLRLAIVLVASLVIGCLLVPPIVSLLRSVGWDDYTAGKIARRIFMIMAILAVLTQLRALHLPKPAQAGFAIHTGAWHNLIFGSLLGFLSMGCISLLHLYSQYRYFSGEDSFGQWAGRIAGAALSAAVIAALEEYLFRGLLLKALRRHFSTFMAIVICSAVFGSMHFFTGEATDFNPDTLRWYDGFVIAGGLLSGIVHELNMVAFAGIFMVGAVLCYATIGTGSLFLSTGLHFGWVFYIKSLGQAFKRSGDSNIWLGGSQVYDGLLGPAALLLLIPLLALFIRRGMLIENEKSAV